MRASEYAEWVSAGRPHVLLDVREPWEYAIAALPNALHLPFATVFHQLERIPRDRPVVVICHHGVRSWHVACILEQNGFDDVINLSGGIEDYRRTVDPGLPGY